MKRLIIVFSICFYVFTGCSKEEKIDPPILGTWQLVENWGGAPPGDSQWHPVKDGHIYIFDSKDKYEFLYNDEITEYECYGRYKVLKDTLFFTSSKCGLQENPNPKLIYNLFSFEEDYLILVPILPVCFEGCAGKYKKIE